MKCMDGFSTDLKPDKLIDTKFHYMKGFYSIYMEITDEVEEIIREALYHDSGGAVY
jgi:hypothetical protein